MKKDLGTIEQFPVSARPYERCEAFGPGALSDAELLSVLLRSGTAGENVLSLSERLLKESGGLRDLCCLPLAQLRSFRGIGRVKALQLSCLGEAAVRIARGRAGAPVLSDPASAAGYYMERLRREEQEVVILAALNTKHRLIRDTELFRGSVRESVSSPREIFREALRLGAVSILLLHNHPSGDPSPSREDLAVTEKIRQGGKLLGIPLTDHIIIGDGRYISLKEQGQI